MVDVTIKEVPEGCEEEVKKMARVAIYRFLSKGLVVPQPDMTTFDNANEIA